MSNKDVLEWAKAFYGGQVYVYKDKRNDKWKEIAHWHIGSRQALSLLVDIKPYLQVKLDEASVAISFQTGKITRKTRLLSGKDKEVEGFQREQLKFLKRRGIYEMAA